MNGFDWKRPTVGLDATDGYKSPVTLYYQDSIMNTIQEETDTCIMAQIRMYVDVDKDELVKALNYDRQQYLKGWNDAVNKYVRFGKWMGTVCTACGESTSNYYDCDYCPHCGARMDE
jgi:hypothetical protein